MAEENETDFVEVEGVKYVPDEEDATKPKTGEDGEFVKYKAPKDSGDDGDGDEEDPDGGKKRPDETNAQKSARWKREHDTFDKKHKLGKYAEQKEDTPSKKSDELDYGQKAWLISKGVEHKDDIAMIQKAMKSSGDSLEEVVESEFIVGKLKTAKEHRDSSEATPKGKKRGGGSTKSLVDYWMKKGGLPENTPENTKLRRDIVKKRETSSSDSSHFTENPVVK